MTAAFRAAQKLVCPALFLFIKHRDNKYFYYIFPLMLSFFLFIFDLCVAKIDLLGSSGIVSPINGLLGILTGFYIAALAAVATFNKPNMDDLMRGEPPILRQSKLTRRQYLSFLFGYLSFLAITIFVLGSFSNVIAPEISFPTQTVWDIMRAIYLILYFFAFGNLISVTLLGLYFLTHRIHREEITIESEKP